MDNLDWDTVKPIVVRQIAKREGSDFDPELIGMVQIHLWENRRQYDASKSVAAWVTLNVRTVVENHRVATASFYSKVERNTEELALLDGSKVDVYTGADADDDFRADVVDRKVDVEAFTLNRAVRQDIYSGLDAVAPRQADALELFYLEGFTMAETAAELSITLQNAKDLVRKGRASLAQKLGSYSEEFSAPTGTLPLVSQAYGGSGRV